MERSLALRKRRSISGQRGSSRRTQSRSRSEAGAAPALASSAASAWPNEAAAAMARRSWRLRMMHVSRAAGAMKDAGLRLGRNQPLSTRARGGGDEGAAGGAGGDQVAQDARDGEARGGEGGLADPVVDDEPFAQADATSGRGRHELLADDQVGGVEEIGEGLVLLAGRKSLGQAPEHLSGRIGVDRAVQRMARLHQRGRSFDRGGVSHLADNREVGSPSQCIAHAIGEAAEVNPDLLLGNGAAPEGMSPNRYSIGCS